MLTFWVYWVYEGCLELPAIKLQKGSGRGRKGVGEGEGSQGDKQGVETLGGKGKAGGGECSRTGAGRGRAGPELGPNWALLEGATQPRAALRSRAGPLRPAAGHCPHLTPPPAPAGAAAWGKWKPLGRCALPASLGRLRRGSATRAPERRQGHPGPGGSPGWVGWARFTGGGICRRGGDRAIRASLSTGGRARPGRARGSE